MKKIFRKNQLVITALALMIAVAGYFSYMNQNMDDSQLAAETGADTAKGDDADLEYEISDEETITGDIFTAEEPDTETNPGEAVLTSAPVSNIDYASEMKLNREQIRSKNKETLLEIVNNAAVSDELKQDAVNKMIAMTDIAERENAAEMLLEAKGFTDVVVSISSDGGADVVLDMGEVTDAKRAQVEDIVARKTEVAPENIVITPIAQQ